MSKLNELMTFGKGAVMDDCAFFSGTNHHLSPTYGGKTLDWFATDTVDRLNDKYSGGDISYVFNSDGYRCDELQQSDLLVIGCSYTFGVGLPVDQTWGYDLATTMGSPYINIAWPGAGAKYMARAIGKVLGVVKPKKVVALMPYNYRMELCLSDDRIAVFTKTAGMVNLLPPRDKDRMNAFIMYSTKKQEDFELLTAVSQINHMCGLVGADFLWSDWTYSEPRSQWYLDMRHSVGTYIEQSVMDNHTRWVDLEKKARDSTHPSSEFHKLLANKFKEYL